MFFCSTFLCLSFFFIMENVPYYGTFFLPICNGTSYHCTCYKVSYSFTCFQFFVFSIIPQHPLWSKWFRRVFILFETIQETLYHLLSIKNGSIYFFFLLWHTPMYHLLWCNTTNINSRGGCSGLPLLLMQHPKKAHINFQSWVFVSKNVMNKILKLV